MSRPKSSAQTRRGEASERIIHALAAEFPKMHTRSSFLRSSALLSRFNKKEGEMLSRNEVRAVSKTLGRLIGDKADPLSRAVSEILWLRGTAQRVGLPEAGLIAVSVDITTLREEEWLRTKLPREDLENPTSAMRGPFLPLERKPTQEGIVDEIIVRSRAWAADHMADGKLPLLLTNVSIVHGSSVFDILINTSMKDEESLLRFTREVIQRIPHVRGTQTMLVSEGYGFSNVSDSLRQAEGAAPVTG